MTINEWCRMVREVAKSKGWEEKTDVFKFLGNLHSEVSEAWEIAREAKFEPRALWLDKETGKPEGFGVELADLVIRTFHVAEFYGIDLEDMIARKTAFNRTRPHRHGGKRA